MVHHNVTTANAASTKETTIMTADAIAAAFPRKHIDRAPCPVGAITIAPRNPVYSRRLTISGQRIDEHFQKWCGPETNA
jgi:hypothetical protein